MTAEVAEQLRAKPGDEAIETRYLFSAEGAPIQSSISWEPWSLIGGTAIEEPEGEGRVAGVVARMDSIGVRVTNVTEKVRARPATLDERHTLQIPSDAWVLQICRTHWAEDQAVETALIVVPGDRYELNYSIPID
jgi:GntR family transcriptional regulator